MISTVANAALSMTRAASACVIVLALGGDAACKRSVPPAPPPAMTHAPQAITISKDSQLLYTYVEARGTFATTDKADEVPEAARRLVRVVDPAKPAIEGQDPTKVYALNLADLLTTGKAQARLLSREAFETGALAQLPPGESSALAGPHGPPLAEDPLGVDAGLVAASGVPVVILYGTPWCGACKAAKQYLAAKHVPFAYKDIENDATAAAELQAKAQRLGVPADRVPILDVRGRLLLGFDRARLDAMLGEST